LSLFSKCRAVKGTAMSNTDNMRVLSILSTQLTHEQFIKGDGAGQNPVSAPLPIAIFDMLAT